MHLNIDAAPLRSQIKLLSDLSHHLEEAAKICDLINGGKESEKTMPPLNVVVPPHTPTRNGAYKFIAGNRGANLENIFKILAEASEPLHQNEILKRLQIVGTSLTKPNTIAVYLSGDNRFKRNDKRGFWELSEVTLI